MHTVCFGGGSCEEENNGSFVSVDSGINWKNVCATVGERK